MEKTKVFSVLSDQPQGQGYAEVLIYARHLTDGKVIRARYRIWFSGNDKYRVESRMSGSPLFYEVRDGQHTFVRLEAGRRRAGDRVRWVLLPDSKIESISINKFLQCSVRLERARLVERGQMDGLQAEHWQGFTEGHGNGIGHTNAWVSTEARYPLVLRVDTRSKESIYSWRVAKLDLGAKMADSLFTPQAHPGSGAASFRSMVFKPPLLYLIWYSLYAVMMAAVVFFIMWRAERTMWPLRGLGGILCIGMVFVLGVSNYSLYCYSFHDTPVAASVFLISCVFAITVLRWFGKPCDLVGRKIVKWPFVLSVPAVALLHGGWLYAYNTKVNRHLSIWIHPSISFNAAILCNAALFTLSTVLIEELVFRGYLFTFLQRHLAWPAVVVGLQALVFGLYHIPALQHEYGDGGTLVSQVCFTIGLGVVLGALRQRYRTLLIPTLMHLAWNLGYIYVALAFGR